MVKTSNRLMLCLAVLSMAAAFGATAAENGNQRQRMAVADYRACLKNSAWHFAGYTAKSSEAIADAAFSECHSVGLTVARADPSLAPEAAEDYLAELNKGTRSYLITEAMRDRTLSFRLSSVFGR